MRKIVGYFIFICMSGLGHGEKNEEAKAFFSAELEKGEFLFLGIGNKDDGDYITPTIKLCFPQEGSDEEEIKKVNFRFYAQESNGEWFVFIEHWVEAPNSRKEKIKNIGPFLSEPVKTSDFLRSGKFGRVEIKIRGSNKKIVVQKERTIKAISQKNKISPDYIAWEWERFSDVTLTHRLFRAVQRRQPKKPPRK